MHKCIYVVKGKEGVIVGLYANEKLASNDAKENGLEVRGPYELIGYNGDEYDSPLPEWCKYFSTHLNTIRELISCLYCLEGCCCGGLAHVVLDDNNLEDHFLTWTIEECDKEENKDREEVGLVKLIMQELLKLSIQERRCVADYLSVCCCDNDCKTCYIETGEGGYR